MVTKRRVARFRLRCAAVLASMLAALSCGTQPAAAQNAADFYRGKQITLVIGLGAGTTYDAYARLLARFDHSGDSTKNVTLHFAANRNVAFHVGDYLFAGPVSANKRRGNSHREYNKRN